MSNEDFFIIKDLFGLYIDEEQIFIGELGEVFDILYENLDKIIHYFRKEYATYIEYSKKCIIIRGCNKDTLKKELSTICVKQVNTLV